MKIIHESKKEQLPVDFIMSFITEGWDKISSLNASIDALSYYKEDKAVKGILQDLLDAYLICVGRLEAHLGNKDLLKIEDGSLKDQIETKDDDDKENLKEDLVVNIDKVVLGNDIQVPAEPVVVVEEPECPECKDCENETADFFCDFDEPVLTAEDSINFNNSLQACK